MTEGKVIYPLLTTNTVVDENQKIKIGTQPVYCVGERCAWFAEGKQACAIKALITTLGGKR